jgi:hypothetical protein
MGMAHDPIGAGVEEQSKLVGRGLGAGGAVGGQMRLPRFDVIFRLAAPAVAILVEYARIAAIEVGDDEASVGSVHAGLDAGDDALDAAPARGAVEKLRETSNLSVLRRRLEPRLRVGLEVQYMPAQGRSRRDAEDEVEALGTTPVENLGTTIMAVAAFHEFDISQVAQSPESELTQIPSRA